MQNEGKDVLDLTEEPSVDLELYDTTRRITPEQFVSWVREKYNLEPREWTTNMQWIQATGELGITAAGKGESHALLILEMQRGSTRVYDPMRGVYEIPTDSIEDRQVMLSPLLEQRGTPKEFLIGSGYRLEPIVREPLQRGEDTWNCGPLAMYAALMACAEHPIYSQKLNGRALKEISERPIDLTI